MYRHAHHAGCCVALIASTHCVICEYSLPVPHARTFLMPNKPPFGEPPTSDRRHRNVVFERRYAVLQRAQLVHVVRTHLHRRKRTSQCTFHDATRRALRGSNRLERQRRMTDDGATPHRSDRARQGLHGRWTDILQERRGERGRTRSGRLPRFCPSLTNVGPSPANISRKYAASARTLRVSPPWVVSPRSLARGGLVSRRERVRGGVGAHTCPRPRESPAPSPPCSSR